MAADKPRPLLQNSLTSSTYTRNTILTYLIIYKKTFELHYYSGHHIYLDVAGKSFTDITFQADMLRPQLYSCPDRFGIAAQTSDVPYAVVS